MSGVFFARPCELGGAGVVQGIGLTPRLVPCLLVWHPGFLSDLRSSRVSPFPVLVFQEGSIRTFAVPGLPRFLFWSSRRVPFGPSQFPGYPVLCSGLSGGFLSDFRSSRVSPFPVLVFQEVFLFLSSGPCTRRSSLLLPGHIPVLQSQLPGYPVCRFRFPDSYPFFSCELRFVHLPFLSPRSVPLGFPGSQVSLFAIPAFQEVPFKPFWFLGFPACQLGYPGGIFPVFLNCRFPCFP